MTIVEMLSALRSQGIRLWVEGEKLMYRAPHGALTAELKSQLVERKAELLSYLKSGNLSAAADFSPISRAERSHDLPLSFTEEGLWLLEQLNPGSTAWNMQSTLRISGALEVSLLEKSLNSLVQRQEILRTAFELRDQNPSRVIAPELRIVLPVLNLHGSSSTDEAIRRIADEEIKTPFELSKVPLFRAKLLRSGETEHILILTKHHLITDAWSGRLFLQELFAFYRAFATDSMPGLTELPFQYADYADWLRRHKVSELESHFSYWKRQLNGVRVVEIPFDRQRSGGRTFRGATERVRLSANLYRSLRDLCKAERATLFMILLAAFKLVLHRYSGETDLVVGSTLTGRSRSELEHLIGMLINILPLRSDFSGGPSFREALKRVREACLEAYQHQDYPFEKLVQAIRPARDPSRHSLFQVLFNVANLPSMPRQVDGLILEQAAQAEDTAKFDLTLFAPETSGELEVIAAYNTEIFAGERIAEMLEQYKVLLEQIVEDPDRKIADYSLMTSSAQKRLPDPTRLLDRSWNGAVHEMFAHWAKQQPEKTALEDAHGRWSYRELNERSNQLAHYLRERGIGKSAIVAIYGHRGKALISALLGVLKAGAAFCVLDPSHPPRRLKEYLSATEAQGMIEIDAAPPQLQQLFASLTLRCRITLAQRAAPEENAAFSSCPIDNPAVAIGPDDLAYVVFTSGSTGKPKGVLGRHGPLTHFLPWLKETFALGENDRFSLLAGLSSNILQRESFTALSLGAALCIPDGDGVEAFTGFDTWMRVQSVSVVHLTPAMTQLLDANLHKPLPAVRRVFFAGDLLRMHDLQKARAWMPGADIVSFYNSSETQRAGGYVVFPRGEAISGYKEVPPLGHGMQDVQLLVINSRKQMAGVGELGEICVRSPHLAQGYLNDDRLTQERFITNPFTGLADDRIYCTGEQGRYGPNGDVEFVARADDHVSIRGFRVALGEIETALVAHPAIRQAAVTAREQAGGDARMTAYVATQPGAAPTPTELRGYLKRTLPDHMIPTSFIFLAELPLSANGKIAREALPVFNGISAADTSPFVPPSSALEKVLTLSWSALLDMERVGIDDNFFELGGHSLLAMQVIARIRAVFNVILPLSCIYQTPTVAGLAAALLRASLDPQRIEKTALLLLEIGQQSEQQLDRLLREKRSTAGAGKQP